jgi:micrococcal nuclease
MSLYTYKAKVIRVIDGDTIKAMIDLGFDTWISITVRFDGFNAPESRTRDLVEKKKGLEAKERVIQILQENGNVFTLVSKGVGKYGRCLADIYVESLEDLTLQKYLISEGLGSEYHGGKR